MTKLEHILLESSVIAAIRSDEDLEKVLNSDALVVFVLYGSIVNIKNICAKLEEASKVTFIHVDLIEGLKGDYVGLSFIQQFARPYGIITTKPTNIKYAKQLGLSTIQRIFVVDSLSLQTGIKNIQSVHPDAVEVMPGVASKIIKSLEEAIRVPIIAGGLIQNKKDVMESINAGGCSNLYYKSRVMEFVKYII